MLGLHNEMTPPTRSSLTVFSQNFKDQSNEQQHANGLIVSFFFVVTQENSNQTSC